MRAEQSVDTVLSILESFHDEIREFSDSMLADPALKRTSTAANAVTAELALGLLVNDLRARKAQLDRFDEEMERLTGPTP
jgi:hypothetical protein